MDAAGAFRSVPGRVGKVPTQQFRGDDRDAVISRVESLSGKVNDPDKALQAVAGREFYNLSPNTFATVTADPAKVAVNLEAFIRGFSPGAQEVLDRFRFGDHRIVEEVWQRLHKLDAASAAPTRQIKLLRERRQALITAAVTGELAVD